MNLIIDIGNSRTKISVFDNEKEVFNTSEPFSNFTNIEIIQKKYDIKRCILSASGHIPEGFCKKLDHSFDYLLTFDQRTPLPFESNYKTPESIGLDRLAGIAGANVLFKSEDVLIIDAGTAITFDVKDKNGIHLGGNISPGMQMRFKALHNFTEKLPLVRANNDVGLLGLTTNEAILDGVVNGIIYEMEGYMNRLSDNYDNLTVILTGGDAHFFVNKLKKTIFVVRNLVCTGLNSILLYNVEEN